MFSVPEASISHDLRHPLTTVLAYAEFQAESSLDEKQRKDLYGEIRIAVSRMTELIASLLEFSKTQRALNLIYGDVTETLGHTVSTLQLHREFKGIEITLVHEGSTEGWFDFKKLDRAFHNLLQNACEAAPANSGKIRVEARGVNNHIEISVQDNGHGIPEAIREEVFQPFVTSGKDEGTGLGLAVVQKIVRDHGGEVKIETTGPDGTTFKIILPSDSLRNEATWQD